MTLAFLLLASLFIGHAQADDGAPAFLNYVQQQEKKEKKEIPPAPEASKPVRARDNNTAALQKKLAAQKNLIADKDKTIRQLQAQLKSQSPAVTPAPVDNSALNKTIAQLQGRITALDTENKRLVQQARTFQQEKTEGADNLKHSAAALQAQTVKLNALETDKQALSDKLAAAIAEKQKLSAELAAVKTTTAATKSPALNLSNAPQQQAYSVGVSIGQDALKTLSSQAAKGLNLQQETVIKALTMFLPVSWRWMNKRAIRRFSTCRSGYTKTLIKLSSKPSAKVKSISSNLPRRKAFYSKAGSIAA